MNTIISFFNNVSETKTTRTIEVPQFLEYIQNGKWQDVVLPIRAERDETKRQAMKKRAPLVTISGVFPERKDASLKQHSGLIAIDIDHLNEKTEEYRRNLAADKYCFAIFTSISGTGLCMLVRIDGARHRDAFTSICSYLLTEYNIVVDPACVNESRARFVSYDPYLISNDAAAIFKKYLPKEKKRKMPPPIFVQNDFDEMINAMVAQSVSCTEDYRDWQRVCFGLASHFGEAGRNYFHRLSAISGKYDEKVCDKLYSKAIRGSNSTARASVATIYYFAKLAGIPIHSQATRRIIRDANSQKKSGITDRSAIAVNLQKFGDVPQEDSIPIIEQVLKNEVPAAATTSGESLIGDIVAFLAPYELRKNEITRSVEIGSHQPGGKPPRPINDSDINSIYLDCKTVYEQATKELVTTILFSNRVRPYNPIHEFINEEIEVVRTENPNLLLLIQSVKTDTPNAPLWITKWLVSLIASAYGDHSPLMLVFAGEIQGTGKTEWFRRLLPKRLIHLFAESKMDNGKDDDILLTKKWIVMDDEFGGKSKKEEKRLKEITSKQWINVREPYGRVHVDLKRLAVFCGTSNDTQLLNDPTGNRRILPVHILDIDKEKYNTCNKEELIRELYEMYRQGYDYQITGDEIRILNENTAGFKQSTPEEELILTKLQKGQEGDTDSDWLPLTRIIQYLIMDTRIQHMSNSRIGMILTSMGFEKKKIKIAGTSMTAYHVILRNATPEQKTYNNLIKGKIGPDDKGPAELPFSDENPPF